MRSPLPPLLSPILFFLVISTTASTAAASDDVKEDGIDISSMVTATTITTTKATGLLRGMGNSTLAFTATSVPSSSRASSSPVVLSLVEEVMFEEISAARSAAGVHPACASSELVVAARDTISRAIACKDHTIAQKLCDGSDPEDRLSAAGYPTSVPTQYSGLVGFIPGCKKDDHGCAVKAVKLWQDNSVTSATLIGSQWLHVGASAGKNDQGEFYFAAFVGAATSGGPYCDEGGKKGKAGLRGERR